jgi:hypothetical protein
MEGLKQRLDNREATLVAKERTLELQAQATKQLPCFMGNASDDTAVGHLRKTVDELTKSSAAERVLHGEELDKLRSQLAEAEGVALKVKLLEQELDAAKKANSNEDRASLQVVKLQNALDVANALRANTSLIKLQDITVGNNRFIPATSVFESAVVGTGGGGVSNAQIN